MTFVANALRTGHAVAGVELPQRGALSGTLDSIVFPWSVRERQDERRVRPALAVLFRIAVGPNADYYARRFVKYERTGRSAPSWHWPAFALPTVWAFYRKLWGYGVACALLPVAGTLAFTGFDFDIGDSSLAWWACAALSVWLIPGIVAATCANTFYYHQVRRLVRRAEKNTRSAETAASRLQKRGSTDMLLALLLGVGTLLFVGSLIGPRLQIAHHAHVMRVKLEQVMAAVKPLQRQVEYDWALTRSIPQRPDYGAVRTHEAFALVDGLDLNPRNGRVRVDLGNAVPELEGRSFLLAPAVDAWQKLRWLCIPIDIPTSYVPAACGR
ncbi:MAG TPA: DUF2628 domain-containing protein [Casimicrobiaceae bacterium]|jgi:hypothetical protein